MKKMIVVASLVFAFGCGKKGGIDGKLDELGKIRDAMCKCTDKACADKEHENYIAWKKGNSKDEKPDEAQMKKYEDIRKELMDCRHKLDTPAAAPAAGADTAGAAAAPSAPAPSGGSATP